MKTHLNFDNSYRGLGFCLLTVLMTFLSGMNAYAQVSTLSAWANMWNGTGNLSTTFTVPAGTNTYRMLVVAVASSQTTTGTARTVTVTYGGQTLSLAAEDMSSTTVRQHTAIYYLNEARLDAATSTTLTATFSGGTTRVNTVWRAVFDYVDQSIAPANFQNFNTATATNTFSFATGLTVTENDQAVKVVSTLRAGNTTPRTITGFGTNWTISNQNTYNVTDGVRNAVGNRSYNATATPVADVSTTNLNGSALPSMTAVSLKAIPKQFRSNATGPWGTIDTWQQSMNLGTSWVAATTTPSSSDHSVTIRNTHVVTLNSAAGAWINLGTFNPGTSTIQFSNAAATMADVPPPYTSFYNLTVQDGAKLTFGTGSYAKILNTQLMMEYYYCPHWQVGMDY